MFGIFRKCLAVNFQKKCKKDVCKFFYIHLVFFIYKILVILKNFGHILFIFNSVSRITLAIGIFQALATSQALALALDLTE